MKSLSFLFVFTTLVACSQNQDAKKYSPHPKAKQLADSAFNLILQSPPKNYEKAILLLEEATKIDSNYFDAYNSKLSFQLSLNKFNEALVSAKNMVRIKPGSPMSHTAIGIIYWQIGDSASAIGHFLNANVLYDKELDTMDKSGEKYETALMNKALNLIFLGYQEEGGKILHDLYIKDKNEDYKLMIKAFMNKSRKEIFDNFFKDVDSKSQSEVIIIN